MGEATIDATAPGGGAFNGSFITNAYADSGLSAPTDANPTPTLAPSNNNNNNNYAATNSTNNNQHQQQRTTSKRRPSFDGRIITGRSFKRLRLDHVHVPAGSNVFTSNQSTGTLSVGTMGGDLESNDEDLGEDDETEEGFNDGLSGRGGGMGGGGGGGCCGESAASSWVASLGGGSFRRRLGPGGALPLPSAILHSRRASDNANAGLHYQSDAAVQFQSLEGTDEDNDAATCSEMTTAAVAPRRRHHPTRATRKRAIGFMMDKDIVNSNSTIQGGDGKQSNGSYDDDDDDLELEDLEVTSLLPLTNGKNNRGAGSHNSNNHHLNRIKGGMMSSSGQKQLPPIGQIPDPLLVAAQHAAGGMQSAPNVAFDMSTSFAPAGAASQNVLVMGDCCSSVTEEDASLAEDEASISAISIGANTTVSALSGGMDGRSTAGGSFDHRSIGAGSGSFDQHTQQKQEEVSIAGATAKPANPLQPTQAMAMSNGSVNNNAYAPLNTILGGLHKERMSRLSTNRPLSRGESSLHSMGSMGAHSAGGASYRSLPGNLQGTVNAVSWNVMPNTVNQLQQQQPPSFIQQEQQKPVAMEEDAVMEEADDDHGGNNHQNNIPAIGSFGNNSSHGGSVASFYSNNSAAAAAVPDESVPKWKRRVNLPAHSTLY